MSIQTVTVYAASSQALDVDYIDAAARLGRSLAQARIRILYGGGGAGLMGSMADAAVAGGAQVIGIIPEFLQRAEHGHNGLHALEVVPDMRERKARMLEGSDAVIALPGGCGTFEELFEAITLKRLGRFLGPIILVNTRGYYQLLLEFMAHSIDQRFMNNSHQALWQVVDQPEEVLEALNQATPWSAEQAMNTAVVRPA